MFKIILINLLLLLAADKVITSTDLIAITPPPYKPPSLHRNFWDGLVLDRDEGRQLFKFSSFII
jgi:hypothetical protein